MPRQYRRWKSERSFGLLSRLPDQAEELGNIHARRPSQVWSDVAWLIYQRMLEDAGAAAIAFNRLEHIIQNDVVTPKEQTMFALVARRDGPEA